MHAIYCTITAATLLACGGHIDTGGGQNDGDGDASLDGGATVDGAGVDAVAKPYCATRAGPVSSCDAGADGG